MGEIAEDCYDRAMEEFGEREDAFFGVGPERPLYSHSNALGAQIVGRSKRVNHREMVAQRNLNLTDPENRDWMFVTIEKAWPFNSHNFKVIQPDLKSAIKDFYENEYHQPFRNDKHVPDYHIDVQIQTTGGWIVFGETQTVLIFCR